MNHTLRPMRVDDLQSADRLRDQAGWNQTPGDWQRLLGWQPSGCFVAEQVDGNVDGTVTTTLFAGATGCAWIGMMLVDQSKRRQGLGRALLSHAVTWLEQAAVGTIGLDATPLGKTLYDQTGFTDVYTLQRRHATVPDPGGSSPLDGVKPLQPDDIARLAELDTAAFFGLDRQRILRDLRAAYPSGCWLIEGSSGGVDGYVLSRRGARAWYIGPLVARDAHAAETLLRAALAPLVGQPAILDTLDPNPDVGPLAAKYGFEPRRPFIRMTRGAPPPASRTDWYFAMAGPEIG
jgi:GNAT superfamily N-acetyltransferase